MEALPQHSNTLICERVLQGTSDYCCSHVGPVRLPEDLKNAAVLRGWPETLPEFAYIEEMFFFNGREMPFNPSIR